MISRFLLLSLITFNFLANAQVDSVTATFSGRISLLNSTAKLARVKIDFENAKYLRKKDRLEFWNETFPDRRCIAYIEGRSTEYILMRIPMYRTCITNVHIATGAYIHLYSKDLESSLRVGQSLVEVLLRKKTALNYKFTRYKKEVDGYLEKIDTVNKRYEVLRQKLEIEWEKELSSLEEDKVKHFLELKHTEARLNELEFKLQKYKIHDKNLTLDKWSLDSKLYYNK